MLSCKYNSHVHFENEFSFICFQGSAFCVKVNTDTVALFLCTSLVDTVNVHMIFSFQNSGQFKLAQCNYLAMLFIIYIYWELNWKRAVSDFCTVPNIHLGYNMQLLQNFLK